MKYGALVVFFRAKFSRIFVEAQETTRDNREFKKLLSLLSSRARVAKTTFLAIHA